MQVKVKTPCIGVCSTGIGDSVCRGCKRFAHEVIRWNTYDEAERKAILDRIEHLLTPLVQARVVVIDEAVLRSALIAQKVRVDDRWSVYSYAYEAIRTFGAQLETLELIGCAFTNTWQGRAIADLKSALEEDFYNLSCAHYERYFPGHI